MKRVALVDPELGPLTDDAITRDFRVFQRKEGHRFSTDDMATAYVGHRAHPSAQHCLDLGCGLGSVLLQLAWTLPEAHFVGIEAQEMSFELLRRNVERNKLTSRATIHHGDLRDPLAIQQIRRDGGFDLITGTPPYFPPDTAVDALDKQRAFARIEYRGGVEAYLTTADQLLGDAGTLVICGDADAHGRVMVGLSGCHLHLQARLDVIPAVDRPVLFSVWTFGRRPSIHPPATETWLLRDAAGNTTPHANSLRAFSGFGPVK